MALEHIQTRVLFVDGDDEWQVCYDTLDSGGTMVDVILNGLPFHQFDGIPSQVKLNAKHPNKTQAEAIIRLAKKLNK